MSKPNKIKFNIIIIIAIIVLSIGTITKTFQEDTFYMIKVRRIHLSKWNRSCIK